MKDKIQNLIEQILIYVRALPKKVLMLPVVLLIGFVSLLKKAMGNKIFNLVLLALGFLSGIAIGARIFDTGWAAKVLGINLKGATVKVTGPCRSGGELRKPGLAEDDVKITFIDDKKLVGMLRATRETIECDLENTAYDVIPPFKNLLTSPAQIPEVKPFEFVQDDRELEDLKRISRIRVRGICQDSQGTKLPVFDGESINVLGAERSSEDKRYIRISGYSTKSKQSVVCSTDSIKWFAVDGNGEEVKVGTAVVQAPQKKDLVGEVILITSTCFPDKRLPTTKISKQVFYPVLNARMQVTQNSFDEDNKLSFVSGVLVDNGAMVECDTNKYPISWKPFDPNGTKLQPINTSSTFDEKASGQFEEKAK